MISLLLCLLLTPDAGSEPGPQQPVRESLSNEIWFPMQPYEPGLLSQKVTKIVAVRGQSQMLVGSDFYDAIERPDLAATYRSRIRWMWAGVIAGSAIGAVGLGGTYFAIECQDDPACVSKDSRRAGKVFASMLVSGLLVAVVSAWWDPHPMSAHEAVTAVDQHNASLRAPTGCEATDCSIGGS